MDTSRRRSNIFLNLNAVSGGQNIDSDTLGKNPDAYGIGIFILQDIPYSFAKLFIYFLIKRVYNELVGSP